MKIPATIQSKLKEIPSPVLAPRIFDSHGIRI
jgi:hypothetical protein